MHVRHARGQDGIILRQIFRANRPGNVERLFAAVDIDVLIACDLDAVLILTSGSHAPIAIAAAQAGRHLLIEKPMCFSVDEGKAMIAAAERAFLFRVRNLPRSVSYWTSPVVPLSATLRCAAHIEGSAGLRGLRVARSAPLSRTYSVSTNNFEKA